MKNLSFALQFLHLMIVISLPLLALLSNKYDLLYLSCIFIIVFNWNIFKGECIISYYEKKLLDPSYKLGDNKISTFKNLISEKYTNLIMNSNYLLIPYVIYRNYGTSNFPILFSLGILIICLMISLKVKS
jgi:hypothetical protein